MSKRVLLFNPPFARIIGLEQDYVPLALLHISTLLKQQGFNPFVKNLNITEYLGYVDYLNRKVGYEKFMDLYQAQKWEIHKEVSEAIEKVKPDMIGFSVLTAQIKIVNDLIAYIKSQYNLPIFVGGAGATLNTEKIKANIIYKGGINDLGALSEIELYDNDVLTNYAFSLEDYDGNLYFEHLLDNYKADGFGHVFSSVGCYYNCRFCASPAIWGRKVYFKPLHSFLRELDTIADRFEPSKFLIWDENFTVNNNRLREFCRLYKLNIPWSCDSRVSSLNEDKIKMMKEAGCYQINLGVESGCQRTLDYLGKGLKLDAIKATFDLLNKYDIKSKVYMLMGFPEETEADIMESIEFVKANKPDYVTLSLFTPYRNTSLYDECIKKGIIDSTYDESDHSHQSGRFIKMIHPEIDIDEIIKEVDAINAKCT